MRRRHVRSKVCDHFRAADVREDEIEHDHHVPIVGSQQIKRFATIACTNHVEALAP